MISGTRTSKKALFLALVLLAASSCARQASSEPLSPLPFQRGVNLATSMGAYSHPDGSRTLEELLGLNVEWIQMVPFAWQRDIEKPDLQFPDHTATQVDFIERLHRRGMHVMMKPHVWSPQFWGENGRWRGELQMHSDRDWTRWFRNYEKFILHYARLSERAEVELFSIGLEYREATRQKPRAWRELIRKVRSVYSGPITYGAHFQSEMEEIPFWEDLDFVGVILYPELTDADHPELEELLRAWGPVAERLRRFSVKTGKPILIAEIGFNSIAGAAHEPWRWARPGSRLDLKLQARLYEATFRVLWEAPWLAGIYFWKWGIPMEGGGPLDIHYTPKGKPSSKILGEWFGRCEPGCTGTGTAAGWER